MREWLEGFRAAPEPLSPPERRLVWIAMLVVAITRVVVAAKSLWDWDEALFSFALRDYDVTQHHPHPPGFPLFIAAVRLFLAAGLPEFRALQIVVLLGAVALFPLMFFFARELRAPFGTAFSAALLLAFAPNVWLYGATGLSDVPSLALVVLACALLLRGCRSGGAYLAGAFVLAVAAGFRPQNLLVGLAPALLATWWRIRITRSIRQPLAATLIGGVTLAAAFGGAAMATGGWQMYREAIDEHRAYITAVDSYRSPGRPPLWRLVDDFFVRPYRMVWINLATGVLSAIALAGAAIGRRKPLLLALLAFGPFCIAGWLMLDHFSASRFSIGWAPLVALAIADGAAIVAGLVRRERVQIAIAGALAVAMAAWAWPGLVIVRTTDSPPVQSVDWIRRSLPPDARLYVHGSMGPYAELLLPAEMRKEVFTGEVPVWPDDRNAWLLREGSLPGSASRRFSYARDPLWSIARQRYFDVSLTPLCPKVRFGEGWHGEERAGVRSFRWMNGARATVLLPGVEDERRLSLQGYLPLDAMDGAPSVTILVDGEVIDRFVATRPAVLRTYVLGARSGPASTSYVLEIGLDRVANAQKKGIGADARDLGMRLDALTWSGDDYDCGP